MSPFTTEVLRVLRAATKWAWHMNRSSDIPPTRDFFNLEFLQVQDETNTSISQITGDDSNQDGIIQFTHKQGERFAFKLVNLTNVPIYPYLFVFDVSEQSIGEYAVGAVCISYLNESIPQNLSTSRRWFTGT